MSAPDDPRRERTVGRGYVRYVAALGQRAGSDQPESVRYQALKTLSELHGVDNVIAQLMDLASNARSDRIALQATDLVAEYLQLFDDKAEL